MRVVAGNFKGKKLLEPKDVKTRPLKDLTKESIFNIISHSNKFSINLTNSSVLDLFSGVGSFGIECLSREAKYVVFVEFYSGVIPILKKNLLNLKSVENYEVIEKDIYNCNLFLNNNKKFNIIFLDPPYKDNKLESVLIKIKTEKILNRNGIIIIHRHKNDQESSLTNFRIIEEKKYGISKITFWTNLE